ncbi:hypothetical protein OGAPHI_004556 [Ogataea philodendri]|uniref:H/ACA snoRNP protein NHP2 n=2 Tax=Ogataea TaxID=461281 RepID=A0A9P8T3P5_9ASCO|nr:uncharacterized protein OGAPHI_004556 [Ogataea philodendri]KAH3664205.1 hypothetical protein OGAPHI_004556 [Ogataea philodendri]
MAKKTDEVEEVDNYEKRLPALLPFAKPLASKKLNKKVLKTVKKASKSKHVKRGVKEVVKALRKGEKGLVIIAGDISPADVISHIPCLCEDNGVPFLFVPSKEDLGSAGATKRPTSCVMIVPGAGKKDSKGDDYKDGYDEIVCSKLADFLFQNDGSLGVSNGNQRFRNVPFQEPVRSSRELWLAVLVPVTQHVDQVWDLKREKSVVDAVSRENVSKRSCNHKLNITGQNTGSSLFSGRTGTEVETRDDDIACFGLGSELRVVVLHTNLSHLLARNIVLVGVFTWVDSVGVDVISVTKNQLANDLFWETWQHSARRLDGLFTSWLLVHNNGFLDLSGWRTWFSVHFFWSSNLTDNGGCCNHFWRGQERKSIFGTHSSLEVSVGSRDSDLTFFQQSGSQSNTWTTSGWKRNASSVQKSLPSTSGLSVGLDLGRGSSNVELDSRSNLVALDDIGSSFDVTESRVGTGNQVRLVDLHVLGRKIAQGARHLHRVWSRNVRRQRRQVDRQRLGIVRIVVGSKLVLSQCFQGLVVDSWVVRTESEQSVGVELDQRLVNREQTRQSTPFGGHVGNSQTVVDWKFLDLVSNKLDSMVQNLVVVEQSTQRHNHVLSGDSLGKTPLQLNLGNRWNLPPGLAGSPDGGSVRSHYRSTQRPNTSEYNLLEANKQGIFHAIDTNRIVVIENLVGTYSICRFLQKYSTLQLVCVENSPFCADLVKKNLSEINVYSIEDVLWRKIDGELVVLAASPDEVRTQLAIDRISAKKLVVINSYHSKASISRVRINLHNPVHPVLFATAKPIDLFAEVEKLVKDRPGNTLVLLPSKKLVKQFSSKLAATTVLSEYDLLRLRLVNQSSLVFMLNAEHLINCTKYLDFFRPFGFSLVIQSGLYQQHAFSPMNYSTVTETPVPRRFVDVLSVETRVLVPEKSLVESQQIDPLVPILVLLNSYQDAPEEFFENQLVRQLALFPSFETTLAQLETLRLVDFSNGYRLTSHTFWKYRLFHFAGRKWIGLVAALDESLGHSQDTTFLLLGVLSILWVLESSSYTCWSLLYDLNTKFKELRSQESEFVTLINFFISVFHLNGLQLVPTSSSPPTELQQFVRQLRVAGQIVETFNSLVVHFNVSDTLTDSVLENVLRCLRKGLIFNCGVLSSIRVTEQPLIRFKADHVLSGTIPELAFELPAELSSYYSTGNLIHWLTLESSTDSDLYPFLGLKGFKEETLRESKGKPVTVEKLIPVNYDLGNLAVFDPNPLDASQISNDTAKNDYLKSVTRDNVQLLINQVLSLPLKKTSDNSSGQNSTMTLIELPDPITQLPREKSVPKAKEPTRWELFAAKKGIKKKGKEGKLVYDEATGEWVNKYGYKGKNKEMDSQWLVEVDDKKAGTEEELIDPRKLNRMERKKLIKKNEIQQKRNREKR